MFPGTGNSVSFSFLQLKREVAANSRRRNGGVVR
jgi:hypothetical protein